MVGDKTNPIIRRAPAKNSFINQFSENKAYDKAKADILVQIATIALLLYRAFAFIVKISALFMKYRETKDPAIAKKLQPFEVPKAIRNIIQRE